MMHRRYFMSVSLLIVTGYAFTSSAQQADLEKAKNLQYFPKNIEQSELISNMRQFAFALGVACTHCHGTKDQTGFNLQGVDFSLDIKPTKRTAREMLRMVDKINSKLLPKISRRSDRDLEVSCFTCHSGIALPEMIEDRVIRTVDADGLQAAIEDYRTVREAYNGSAAYNFKEQPLVEVADHLHQSGEYEAAAAISRLNLEFHPDSRQSKLRLAGAYAESGDKDKARQIYLELLKARPDDRRLKQRLEALDRKED